MCACVLRLACKPLNISEATHITVVLANSCSTERMGKRTRAKARAGGSPASQLVGWTTSCPTLTLISKTKISPRQHICIFP